MKVLVAGWFSWENMGTTAGDLIARDVVCNWLKEAGIEYEVAVHSLFPYNDPIDWTIADPDRYTDIVFVCGPFGNGYPVTDMLARFYKARLIGVNLSLLDSLENWNPFTLLYERDSSRTSNPDITFYGPPPKVPVVGLILAHKQKEYKKRSKHEEVHNQIDGLLNSREMSVVPIDTSLENNAGKLRTPGEVESLIARMDIIITTRLHGTVLALKNGIPVIPVDPIEGGAKISMQVKTIGWPLLLVPENINANVLSDAFTYCLQSEARSKALECSRRARYKVDQLHMDMITHLMDLKKTEMPL